MGCFCLFITGYFAYRSHEYIIIVLIINFYLFITFLRFLTGIFLTDLVYIDIAHPVGSPHRTAKMAVVLKALERYQSSEYDITPMPQVANYLNSVRYIEELQKFLEDDQYK